MMSRDKSFLLNKGDILVKRLPMVNAQFEVAEIIGSRVVLRRIDGSKRDRAHTTEIEASYLQRHGYLLASEAAPHPLEAELKLETDRDV